MGMLCKPNDYTPEYSFNIGGIFRVMAPGFTIKDIGMQSISLPLDKDNDC